MTLLTPTSTVQHAALIGNFPPRRCGIATFTADLQSALARADPSVRFSMIAMNDPGQRHRYPSTVGYEISQNQSDNYLTAAEHINALNPDVVSIQHEFGIFGGLAGQYLLKLTEPLRAPVVTTLHTVLSAPTEEQRRVIRIITYHFVSPCRIAAGYIDLQSVDSIAGDALQVVVRRSQPDGPKYGSSRLRAAFRCTFLNVRQPEGLARHGPPRAAFVQPEPTLLWRFALRCCS